ncbi:DUF881 domain-containing protein [Streptomyces sp. MS19]|uniref:DUF881 domain-containing protein n=1 Tax=Streptomyces sp. MS19 TaxID=3385972 RepID=UPI0039A00640
MPQQESGPRRPARPDASMSLLTTVMSHTLDEGYARAARGRRAAAGAPLPRPLRARLWLAGGLLLAALVVTLGAAHARQAAPTVAREREELLERVEAGTDRLDSLQEDVNALREDVAAMRRGVLADEGAEDSPTALLAGATAVEGPGVELTVNDAERAQDAGGATGDDGFSDTGRVRDRDLQRVVNGLWEAGAEAISVNGQRLTALSAIRAAGDAVLVDNRPLVPPYTLLAIGGGAEFADGFDATPAGAYLAELRDDYGIRVATRLRDDLRLPAAANPAIRTATPLDDTGGASATGNTGEEDQ